VYENESFLVTTKKRMIYKYFVKYKETEKARTVFKLYAAAHK